jgi:hypothetical protein
MIQHLQAGKPTFLERRKMSLRQISVPIIATILACLAPIPAHANLVQNGDFSGGSSVGWTFLITSDNFADPNSISNPCIPGCGQLITPVVGQPGKYAWLDSIDLGFGSLVQYIATIPGQTYEITYSFGVRNNYGSNATVGGHFFADFGSDVSLSSTQITTPGGQVLFPSIPFGSPDALTTQSFTSTATGNQTALAFSGSCPSDCSFVVTDVTVNLIPEPASGGLVVLALVLAGAVSRRHLD